MSSGGADNGDREAGSASTSYRREPDRDRRRSFPWHLGPVCLDQTRSGLEVAHPFAVGRITIESTLVRQRGTSSPVRREARGARPTRNLGEDPGCRREADLAGRNRRGSRARADTRSGLFRIIDRVRGASIQQLTSCTDRMRSPEPERVIEMPVDALGSVRCLYDTSKSGSPGGTWRTFSARWTRAVCPRRCCATGR